MRLVWPTPVTYALTFLVSTLLSDLEDARALDAGPPRGFQYRGLDRLVLHRAELVEERRDPQRHDDQGQQIERQRQQAGPQPPALRASGEQPVRHPQHQRADGEPHAQALELVRNPFGEFLRREPIGVLAREADVVGKRQLDQEQQHREQDQVDDQRRVEAPARQVAGHRAQPAGKAGEEQQQGQGDGQPLLDPPDEVAAPVVAHGLFRRRRHGDGGILGGDRGAGRGIGGRWSILGKGGAGGRGIPEQAGGDGEAQKRWFHAYSGGSALRTRSRK